MHDSYQVSMAMKMATVDKAEELLEKLRSASWDAAVQGMTWMTIPNRSKSCQCINFEFVIDVDLYL